MSIRLRKNLTHIPEINSVEYILCMQLFMHFHHGLRVFIASVFTNKNEKYHIWSDVASTH